MTSANLWIVSGMPGVGKTHIATQLAKRYGLPLVAKDYIKESLFETLGTGEPRWSRLLSTASFGVMFTVAAQILDAGGPVLLEGNFRAGEHDAAVGRLLAGRRCRLVQVLCRLPDDQRRQRLIDRAERDARHPGHLDRLFLRRRFDRDDSANQFLEAPGERIVHNTHSGNDNDWQELIRRLDNLHKPVEAAA
jgi:predicted kinase